MRIAMFFIVSLGCLSINIQAQLCKIGGAVCYQVDTCFRKDQIKVKDYKYATVNNIYKSASASVDLYMTVYSPCTLPDNIADGNIAYSCLKCRRPFILMIHGGGFRQGCRKLMENECIEFARRGYVAATIDYRLGWQQGDENTSCANFCYTSKCQPGDGIDCKHIEKDSLNLEMYRAIQDASAAMRFVVHYANNLNIDTNYLYIDGNSAGAIIATHISYMDQKDLNLALPNASLVLGLFNNYGNSFTDTYKIAGIFNNWGSIADTIYINGSQDKIPMIAFHGMDDSIVPYSKGYPFNCKKGGLGYTYGSSLIYQRLKNTYPDMPLELYSCYGGHGIFNDNPATNLKSLYRIQKAVCFFYRARNCDKSQKYLFIEQKQTDITYQELDSISSVNCNSSCHSNNLILATLKDKKTNIQVTVSPNPVSSIATLFIIGKFSKMNITLTDMNGRIFWKKQDITQNHIGLPVSNLTAGLYLVFVKNDEYSGMTKFSKSD